MRSTIDLHTHSNASDGLLPPVELARAALEAGVTTLAVCDHDTAAGAGELLKNAPDHLRFIPGVEVSARTETGNCHILGLGCALDHPAFRKLMDNAGALRRNKLEARIGFIKKRGLAVPEAEYDRLRAMPGAGKPQVADVLVKYGHAPDLQTAIREIVDRCPPVGDRVEAGEVIASIRAAGGVAVWAHPYGETGKRALTEGEYRSMLAELLMDGLAAMECWYARYGVETCEKLERDAQRHGLLVSGGSDCHSRPDTAPLGTLNAEGRPVEPARLTVMDKVRDKVRGK